MTSVGGGSLPTVSESRLGRPPDVVAVSRTVFVPVVSVAVVARVCQVAQSPVGAKVSVPWPTPLTVSVAGRSDVVPLANRKVSGWAPSASTLNSTAEPTALAVSTNPVPVNPGWLLATTPLTIVACSASYRTGAAAAGDTTPRASIPLNPNTQLRRTVTGMF